MQRTLTIFLLAVLVASAGSASAAAAAEPPPVRGSHNESHNGGHCQFATSYDNGRSFVVISTIFRRCLLQSNGG